MKLPFFWRKDVEAKANAGLGAAEGETGMHGPSPVLDENGKPLDLQLSEEDKAALSEEDAQPEVIGYRAFWDESVARGLTPDRLASILQQTKRGDIRPFLELAEEMEERDLHYFAVLSTRKRAVARLEPSIDADSAKGIDKKIVDAVEDLVGAPEFHGVLRHMMDALGKGFSVTEIIWAADGGMWRPAAYRKRDPKYFTFDYISRTEVRLAEMGALDGVPLAPAKFIVHTPELKAGIPIRGGFAWIVAWAWLFKQYTLKDWVSFLDIFGMPIRVGKYHPSATAKERRTLLQAVSRIAVDAAAIIPESMVIEFLESKGFADKPFQNMGEYLDKQISKAVLGQTMTTDGQAGGLAQAKVHDEVRIDILEDDARDAEVTINRDLIRWFVQLNFGAGAKSPYVRLPVAEPQDVAIMSTAVSQLVQVGLRVSQQEMRQKIGLREPDEGEEILQPPAAASKTKVDPDTSQAVRMAATNAALHGLCSCGCGRRVAFNAQAIASGPAPHDAPIAETDALVGDALSDWEEVTDPLLRQLIDIAHGAKDLDEVMRRATAARLDMGPLMERLAKATAISRGLGDVKD